MSGENRSTNLHVWASSPRSRNRRATRSSLISALLNFVNGWQGAHALNRAILGEYFGNSHYARLWGMLSMGTTPFAAAGPVFAGWVSDTSGYGAVIFTFMLMYGASGLLYYNCRRPPIPTASPKARRG